MSENAPDSDPRFERLAEFYASGEVPWDQQDPPPEIIDFIPTLTPGRALDLGCGFGRASLFMARHGWQVDAVDFIPAAIDGARARAEAAGLGDRINFHMGPVTGMTWLSGPYDFAVDVGCCHSLPLDQLRAYHGELLRLLRPGAHYLLFAHLHEDTDDSNAELRWVKDSDLLTLFSQGFALDRVEYGETQVGDQAPWRSAWFWFSRV